MWRLTLVLASYRRAGCVTAFSASRRRRSGWPGGAFRLWLVETPTDVGPERVFDILVDRREIEPVRIEVAAASGLRVCMLRVRAVSHDGQESLVTVDATDIFGARAPSMQLAKRGSVSKANSFSISTV